MIKIAIITALSTEANDVGSFLQKPLKTDLYGHFCVQEHLYNGNLIYIVKASVGEIMAAAATQLVITKYAPDYIINFGFAGGYNDLKMGECVLVSGVVHYDFDLSKVDDCKPAHYHDIFDSQIIPTDKGLYDRTKALLFGDLKSAILASGDKFITDSDFKKSLYSDYNATVFDMEAAAILLVSYNANIPCLILKVISDNGGKAQYYDFKNLVSDAKKTFSHLIKQICDMLFES